MKCAFLKDSQLGNFKLDVTIDIGLSPKDLKTVVVSGGSVTVDVSTVDSLIAVETVSVKDVKTVVYSHPVVVLIDLVENSSSDVRILGSLGRASLNGLEVEVLWTMLVVSVSEAVGVIGWMDDIVTGATDPSSS